MLVMSLSCCRAFQSLSVRLSQTAQTTCKNTFRNHRFLTFRTPALQLSSTAGSSFDANDLIIPLDKLEFSFARSSGPGGKNVNKLNTKAEVRFNIYQADWLPFEVKQRLLQQQVNKINNEGEIVVSSQEHRTQNRNKEDAVDKLRVMIAEAYVEPKERNMYEGISEKGKIERKDEKRKRGAVKQSRTSNRKFDFDD